MKIKVGIRSLEEAGHYLDRGADELSFGLADIPSHCASQSITGAPRRQVAETVRRAHSMGRGVYVVANDSDRGRPESVAPELKKLFVSTGIDGFIVNSPELISAYPAGGRQPDWHLSTLAMCFNSAALEFYRPYGISRFVIPQHLMPREAAGLLASRGRLKAEVFFILREMCTNVDGLCYGCDKGSEFGYPDTICCHRDFSAGRGRTFAMPRLGDRARLEYFYAYARTADVLKIARAGDAEKRVIVFDEARELLRLAGRCASAAAFLREAEAAIKAEFAPRYYELYRRRGKAEKWEGEWRKR